MGRIETKVLQRSLVQFAKAFWRLVKVCKTKIMASNDELACVYAALILADDQVAVTADKLTTILKAPGVSVEPYWPSLFSKALEGVNIKDLVTNVGSSAGAAPAAGGAPAASGGDAPAEAKKEEKKEESEESDEDMGFGLFDKRNASIN